jgi:hypothetical protein
MLMPAASKMNLNVVAFSNKAAKCRFFRLPENSASWGKAESSLGVARVMTLDALGQKSLPSTLTAPGKSGTAGFGFHARAESVLILASALRWLIGAFHKTEI